ncbi:hypothetical protein TNCV_1927631 [Trichonephila clavipes]|nr:hypothetical protein TNCV_1927631 [Trichonephila clavipes]
MFLAPQYLVFPVRCSQRVAENLTLGLKDYLCKTAVECFPGNSSSRNNSSRSRYREFIIHLYPKFKERFITKLPFSFSLDVKSYEDFTSSSEVESPSGVS